MNNVKTIMVRELGAFFYSPIAYVVLTIFLILSGFFFAFETFTRGGEASLRPLFSNTIPLVLVFVLPLLAMRLIAEEHRSGTIETLTTAPVTDLEVVLGKFLGVGVFYLVLLACTLVYAIIIALYGPLDPLLLICNYVGLILLGALYLSVGLLFSAMTRNQIIAGLSSLVVLLVFTLLADYLAAQIENWTWLRVFLQQASILSHYRDIARGRLDLGHVVFFLTSTGFCLFLTTKVLESRRWR